MMTIKRKNEFEIFEKIKELKSNQKSMYETNLVLIKKLDRILSYAKRKCDDYIDDSDYDCEFCDGVFMSCRKVLQLAGEDISKYE